MNANATNAHMKDGWLERLQEVISEDKRSMRALSLGAGLGPNYISQMISDGKDPGGDKLLSILDLFDDSATAYIFLGVRMTAEDVEMLSLYSGVSDEARRQFRGLLSQMQHAAET